MKPCAAIFLLIGMSLSVSSVLADTHTAEPLVGFTYADIAYQHQQYDLALRELSPLVDAGQAEAQMLLATMYHHGHGLVHDMPKALELYQLAAQQNVLSAQLTLAKIYNDDTLPDSYDPSKALLWYLAAAEQGSADAQYEAVLLLEQAVSVDRQHADKMTLLTQAAEQGHAIAQYLLGLKYDQGVDVDTDFDKAFYWFSQSAEQGVGAALLNVANMYERGEGIVKNDNKSMVFYKKAALIGEVDAQYALGVKYYLGEGVPADLDEAIFWMTKANDQGMLEAGESLQFMLSQQPN